MPQDVKTPHELLEAGDVEGFLAWHRQQPWHGFVMTTPTGGEQPPAGQQPPAPGQGAPAPPAGGQQQEERQLPQSEVDRIAAREKDQGKRAGQRAALEALGFDPDTVKLEDVRKTLDTVREQEQARMTEVERREAAAVERERVAQERENAANERDRQARLTAALLEAGTSRENLDDARTLLSTVPADADDTAVAEAVAALKGRLPALFTGTAPPPPPGGSFTGTPPRPQPNGDAMQRGAERARRAGLAPAADATR